MSAIAFYDSGRLLPYRHDLKQKQIEQRNIDAENTRKYIGYAGGAFANMAERTGTIFGARLGSTPQQKDPTTGAMVDVPQKYGGGTTGAEYAKADWQKGMMDNEDHRRTVTHKLGLLTENVKYSTLRRHHEAWGGIDDKAAKEQFDNRWEQYHLDVKGGTMTKAQLIQKYHDFFEPDVLNLVKEYNAKDNDGNFIVADEDTRAQLLEGLNQFSPYNRWLKYAEENKLYDPSVAGKSRPEVDLLMAFLKDEVKFPGINEMLANRDDTKQQQKLSALQQEQQKNPSVTLLEQLLEKRKGVTTTDSSGSEKTMLEKQDLTWSGVAKKLLDLPENLVKAEEQEKYKLLREEHGFSKRGGVGQDQIIPKPSVPDAIDFNVQPYTIEERSIVRKHFGKLPLDQVFLNLPTVTKEGEELSPLDKAVEIGTRLKDAVVHKLSNNESFFGEPSDAEIYGGVTEDEKRIAADLSKAKLKQIRNQAVLKLRMENKDGGELQGAVNKVEGWWNDMKGWIESNLIKGNTKYEGLGGLAYIQSEAERIIQKRLFGDEVESEAVVKPETNIQTRMIRPSSSLKIDPKDLNPIERKALAISHVIGHEDPTLAGRVIDDNKRAILGGSVDAWELTQQKDITGQWGTNEKLNRHIISNVLKITDPTKMRAFVDYFNTKDMDEHLGHIKKDKKTGRVIKNQLELTDIQKKRRKLLELTPEQTKALVIFAYDRNLATLTNSHGFLNEEVYMNNPSLHHLLGDLAYRHGGSFMTSSTAGYIGLADAVDHALNPTEDYSRATAIAKMDRLLFGQGTYSDKNNKGVSDRYKFLKKSFSRFKDNTDGINVATKYRGKNGPNITLVDTKVTPKGTIDQEIARLIKNNRNQFGIKRTNIPTLRYK